MGFLSAKTIWEYLPRFFDLKDVFECNLIHPPKQTWNLKMDPWKRRFLLETIISRFHVNFQGCTSLNLEHEYSTLLSPPKESTSTMFLVLHHGILHSPNPGRACMTALHRAQGCNGTVRNTWQCQS